MQEEGGETRYEQDITGCYISSKNLVVLTLILAFVLVSAQLGLGRKGFEEFVHLLDKMLTYHKS